MLEEINDRGASKPVTRHFNLVRNHSQKQVAVCGLSLQLCNTESYKNMDLNLSFKFVLLLSIESTNAFHSSDLTISFHCLVSTNHVASDRTKAQNAGLIVLVVDNVV